jgi:general secretion pathway protein D
MNTIRFQNSWLALPAICLMLLPVAPLLGQMSNSSSIRPSSAANGSTRSSSGGAAISSGYSSGSRQYRSNTMLGDALIQIDPESRSLVIVADEETHNEVLKVIKSLDRPKPQVLIKVVFAEVTLNKSLDVGIEGSYTFNVANGVQSGSNSTTTTSTANAIGGTAQTSSTTLNNSALLSPGTVGTGSVQSLYGLAQLANGSFVRLATDNWQATLYALAQRGNVNVLSRPSIMARNNQEAVIVVGQEVPFVTNSQITQLGQTINTIQYQDVGIILLVSPFITSDRTVEMIVSPEISSVDSQSVTLSPGVSSPIINKRAAETVVVTPDSTTVVIGGMMQKQQTSNVQKIPLLGDLPLIGAAFRHTTKSNTRTELLIFLTPYIVEGTSKLKQLTDDEINRTELPQKAFSQEDLHKYLDGLHIKQRENPNTPPPSQFDSIQPENLINKLYDSDKDKANGTP